MEASNTGPIDVEDDVEVGHLDSVFYIIFILKEKQLFLNWLFLLFAFITLCQSFAYN